MNGILLASLRCLISDISKQEATLIGQCIPQYCGTAKNILLNIAGTFNSN